MKVAIVHDWLVGGGAEKVVLELHRMYPDASIYTSYSTDEWRKKLNGKVVTGYLQNWPFSRLRKFIPFLRIWWFTRLKLDGYDLVISSTGNGEAKGIRVPKGTKHICYCNSPTHFYWRHYNYYLEQPGFGAFSPLARVGLRLLVGPLRRWDLKASERPDIFIANSTHIQNDIKKYYGRDSEVIFPPVDTDRFQEESTTRSGFVTVGRLVPNKRVDIIVQACTQLALPLTVVGRGPDLARLQQLAGPTISFDINASDEAVSKYMASAEAFLFASFEDFGITPVEAMSAGTPVIAYKAGGALDYVDPGKTGEFFQKQSAESLVGTLKSFKPINYSSGDIKKAAQKFSADNFQKNMQEFINTVI